MKKALRILLCFLLSLSFFGSTVSAAGYTLTLNNYQEITVPEGDVAVCYFKPAKNGYYTFYSSTYAADPQVTFYDENNNMFTDDDSGEGWNFSISHYMKKDVNYRFEVSTWGGNQADVDVMITETWAMALSPEMTVDPGDNVSLNVVGLCTSESGVDYDWYEYFFDPEIGDWESSYLEDEESSSLTISNIQHCAHYECCVYGNNQSEYIEFNVLIQNSMTVKMEPQFFTPYNSTAVIDADVQGNTAGTTYYWYGIDTGEDLLEQYLIEETSVPQLSIPVEKENVEIVLIARDKYWNLYNADTVVIPYSNKSLKDGQRWTITNSTGDARKFVPTETTFYMVMTTGDQVVELKVVDQYGNETEGIYPSITDVETDYTYYTGNRYIFFPAEKGKEYMIITVPHYNSQTTLHLRSVDYDRAVICNLANDWGQKQMGVVVGWQQACEWDRTAVYRRVHGTGSWTKLTSDIVQDSFGPTNDFYYADTSRLKMGESYDYAIKFRSEGKWGPMSQVETIFYNPFQDIANKQSTFKYVSWAYNNSIVGGIDGYFMPDTPCTRAQLAVMLYKLNGKPSVSGTMPFTDVGSYSLGVKKAILWCYQKGIVGGISPTEYGPDEYATRQQMAIMLWKMAGRPSAPYVDVFADIDSCKNTAKKAIMWLYNK